MLARGRSAAAQAELAEVRGRLRRTRRKLQETKAELETLREEHRSVRLSVRDPFPDVVLPADVDTVIDAVVAERLSFLQREDLCMLARLVQETETSGRKGVILETGTALGGSAIVMAAAKAVGRPMRVYDVFDTIPPPTDRDGEDVHRRYDKILRGEATGHGGDVYYGYRDDLLAEVTGSFERLGVPVAANDVTLVKGLFQDTLEVDEPVALAHLDGDWYESTMTCLERITPHLVPGGRLVLDDYFAWSGCREAVEEYFAGRRGFRLEKRVKAHVVRLP